MSDSVIYHYSDFVEDITAIENQIKFDPEPFKPDLIVGLTRGGLIPATTLSHTLNVPMRTIEWSKTKQRPNQDICELVSAQTHNILVVDDIIDTGELLIQLFEDWDKWATFDNSYIDTNRIRVASLVNHDPTLDLYSNLTGSITGRYFGRHFTTKPWVTFFWETI